MYAKLFTKILDSSIWMTPTPTRIVWITLLAAMDADGFAAFAAPGNLAHRARVSDAECAAALAVLEAPDPHSADPDHEGIRIERVPGGWLVLNAAKYRAIVTKAEADRLHRERQQRYRDSLKQGGKRDARVTARDADVTGRAVRVTQSEAEADTEREEIQTVSAAPLRDAPPAELTFPTVGKGSSTWPLTVAKADEWQALYLGVDVADEMRKAFAWITAKPTRRKTARGMPAFLVGWLNRATDRGAAPAGRERRVMRTRVEDDDTKPFCDGKCESNYTHGKSCGDTRRRLLAVAEAS